MLREKKIIIESKMCAVNYNHKKTILIHKSKSMTYEIQRRLKEITKTSRIGHDM